MPHIKLDSNGSSCTVRLLLSNSARSMMATGYRCSHSSLVVDVSPTGDEAGYKRLDWKRRVAATTPSGRVSKSNQTDEPRELASTFPGPLVLPGDDLAYDPSHPPQSLRSWSNLRERNRVTCNRKTIYVARPPLISEGAFSTITRVTSTGLECRKKGKAKKEARQGAVEPPPFDDTLEYLRAFYHGFEVKEYTPALLFEPWGTSDKDATPSFVGLKEGPAASYTRIRVRPSPDGLFAHQLNLGDLLDGAIRILPKDAYALLILVDHDLYEDDDDDFCCGRAYGGSRVAVVSPARYNPLLHECEGIDQEHTWPASHCASYVASQSGLHEMPATSSHHSSSSPLHQAVTAFRSGLSDLDGLWLFCLARTAAHELGHCFGLGHCVYYACVMQGTASVAEDYRQPPYLCPIDARKLAWAAEEGGSGRWGVFDQRTYEREACEAMVRFCARWEKVGVWAGYRAWLETRLRRGTV